MQKGMIVALVVAVGSGIAIGLQSTLNNWAGRLVGPTSTGLLVNFGGGVVAGVLLLLASGQGVVQRGALQGTTPLIILTSGVLGIAIITGLAYSLPRVGIAAGLSAIILGQMVVAVVVDSLGWGGGEPIPLGTARIAGLALLLLGIWFLLPRR